MSALYLFLPLPLDATTTDLLGHTETAREGGTGSRLEIGECTGVRKKGVAGTEGGGTVGGTETETITVTITGKVVELIMTGARGTTTVAPGNEGSRTGREGPSISCRKPGEENTKQIRFK